MKRVIAFFIIFSLSISLVGCTTIETPQPSAHPDDEGFEHGYLFYHEAGPCNTYKNNTKELEHDIVAFRTDKKSFSRKDIDKIEFEISYGTFQSSVEFYSKYQSIQDFSIVAISSYGSGEPVILSTHNEQLISDKYTYYNDGAAFESLKDDFHGWEKKFNNSEIVNIPSSLFTGEKFGTISLWAVGENELDANNLVYKYGTNVYYTVDCDTITLCDYDDYVSHINTIWSASKKAETQLLTSTQTYSSEEVTFGGMVARPILGSFNMDNRESVDVIIQLWNDCLEYFQDIDCPSFDISIYNSNDDTFTPLLTIGEQFFTEKLENQKVADYINTDNTPCKKYPRTCGNYYIVSVPVEFFGSPDYGTVSFCVQAVSELHYVNYWVSLSYLVNDNIITMCRQLRDGFNFRSYGWMK